MSKILITNNDGTLIQRLICHCGGELVCTHPNYFNRDHWHKCNACGSLELQPEIYPSESSVSGDSATVTILLYRDQE